MKRGQVTVFIITGIIIFVAIILFFFLRQELIPNINEKPEENPNSFLEVCIEDKLIEGVELISSQGGYLQNSLNKTFRFSDGKKSSDISYLCYNKNFYLSCINQEPVLISHLKKEVREYIQEDVKKCFDDLVLNLDKRGYVVDAKYNDFELELKKNQIVINISGKIKLTKSKETSNQEELEMVIPTRFYDLAIVVQEIVSQEARFCNFDNMGFMTFYPKFDIRRFRTGDSTTIYTVRHKDTQEEFKFAVRGCVIPPGF